MTVGSNDTPFRDFFHVNKVLSVLSLLASSRGVLEGGGGGGGQQAC